MPQLWRQKTWTHINRKHIKTFHCQGFVKRSDSASKTVRHEDSPGGAHISVIHRWLNRKSPTRRSDTRAGSGMPAWCHRMRLVCATEDMRNTVNQVKCLSPAGQLKDRSVRSPAACFLAALPRFTSFLRLKRSSLTGTWKSFLRITQAS